MSIIAKLQMLITQEMANLEVAAYQEKEDRESNALRVNVDMSSGIWAGWIGRDIKLSAASINAQRRDEQAFIEGYIKALREAEEKRHQAAVKSVFESTTKTNPRSEWLL